MPRGITKPKVKLTKSAIDALTASDPRGERIYDTELRGFGVVVYPTGRRSFFLDYGPKGNRRRIILGAYGPLTLDQARKKATAALAGVHNDVDPLQARNEVATASTFGEWVEVYLASSTKRSKREDERYLGRCVKRWGKRKLESLKVGDVDAAYQAEKQRGQTTANRWHASLRACLEAAWRQNLVTENVAKRVRHGPEPTPRSRTLTDEELGRFLGAVDAHPDPFARAAFRWLVQSGGRASEVLRAVWEDLDLADLGAATWRVPRPKSGRPVVKPLTRETAEMLAALPRKSRFVIAGRDPFKPRFDLKKPWYEIIAAAGLEGVRLHDLRRSYGLAVARLVGVHLASKLLGHTNVAVTAAHYAPLGLDEMRQANERLAEDRKHKVALIKPKNTKGQT